MKLSVSSVRDYMLVFNQMFCVKELLVLGNELALLVPSNKLALLIVLSVLAHIGSSSRQYV